VLLVIRNQYTIAYAPLNQALDRRRRPAGAASGRYNAGDQRQSPVTQ
jgi:hypothetical protein